MSVEAARGGVSVRDVAFEHGTTAQLLVDATGILVGANALARKMFAIPDHELDRPLRDLRVSYRPVELRAAIDEAYELERPVRIGGIVWGERSAARARRRSRCSWRRSCSMVIAPTSARS